MSRAAVMPGTCRLHRPARGSASNGFQLSSYHAHSGHSSAGEGNERCSGFTFAYTMRVRSSSAPGRPADKQHVLVGVVAAFVQPGQYGDRDVGGRPPGAAFLSPGEGRLYAWLMICDSPHRSLTDLAAELGVSKTAASTVARQLEAGGMIERTPTPNREHRYRVAEVMTAFGDCPSFRCYIPGTSRSSPMSPAGDMLASRHQGRYD
jgi:MarR family